MTKSSNDGSGEVTWRRLTCADEDDFVAIAKRSRGFFDEGDSIMWGPVTRSFFGTPVKPT